LDGGSLYGKIRRLAGVEKCSLLFYEEPELMDELFERMHLIAMDGLRRTLAVTKVDYLGFGDDIAYKTSTLISPAMFDKYLLPRYKEACSYAMDKGVDIVWYDSDGYIYPLMDSFLKAGITGFAPMEAAAGMDPVKFRRTYGRQVRMIGGLDKRAIAAGPESIRREVCGKADVIREGGYIPAIDHDIPPDISLADFSCLVDTLREVYGTL
ncbi:MAG: uroporphyrinogen decarboxylase family protein, partial [bacterium]|nr:uroporphyrinogen decarboxylase family protein [bacterium]